MGYAEAFARRSALRSDRRAVSFVSDWPPKGLHADRLR